MPALSEFLQRRVVLDTTGPMIYIGLLLAFDERGYWLSDADVHDRQEGHATKEEYISKARELEVAGELRVNRRRIFVDRAFVISLSALDDIAPDLEER